MDTISATPGATASMADQTIPVARQPRIIETIPKRGYRIIAPIARGVRPPGADVVAPLDAAPPSDTRLVTGFWPLVVLLAVVIAVVLLLLAGYPA